MMRNITTKLVYRPTGVSELYDLTKDPRELNNVYNNPQYGALRLELINKLLDWMVLTGDVTPDSVDSRGGPAFPHPIDAACVPAESGSNDQTAAPKYRDLLEINGVLQEH